MRRSDGKWFLTRVKRTIYANDMVADGDRIALGLSGGKDSAALLFIMTLFQKHTPVNIALQPVYVDLGWQADPGPLRQLCSKMGLELHVEKTAIARVVFERRKEKNPCALCANMRRGALHQAAIELGCNKVALGHHLDDAVETFFMNLIYTGQLGTFKPVTYLDRADLHLIRPLILLPEATLAAIVKREKLPLIENPCPVSGHTARAEMKKLVGKMQSQYPDFLEKWRAALINSPFWNTNEDSPGAGQEHLF